MDTEQRFIELENRIKQLEVKLGIMDKNPDIAINWQDAPKWANFYFVDKEGHSYWVERKPTKDGFFGSGKNQYLRKTNERGILAKRPQ